MAKLLQIGSFVALLVAVGVLFGTSLPTWVGGHLAGNRLLGHMMASGVVVVLLPLYGFLRWNGWLHAPPRSWAVTIAFWMFVGTGFLTIASMFACMLPLPSTSAMRELIDLHGWLGSTMVVAAVFNGWFHFRHRQA